MSGEDSTEISNLGPIRIGNNEFPEYRYLERSYKPERFLTVAELVEQTGSFMERFVQMDRENRLPDSIFFFDKSARPLAYLFRKLFPFYCLGQEMPKIRYVNIGSTKSADLEFYIRPFNGNQEELRRWYGDYIDTNGRILLVDEYSHTGGSLKKAKGYFQEAFPEAQVETMAAYSKVPNWYENSFFNGVKEYNYYNYDQMAINRLNSELGTNYPDSSAFRGPEDRTVYRRYREIFDEIVGSIPFTQRGDRIETTYEKAKPRLRERVMGKKVKLVKKEVNRFMNARHELDRICELVFAAREKENEPMEEK